MTNSSEAEWGHASRHYAELPVHPGSASKSQKKSLSPLEKRWADLLNVASPGTRDSVDRAFRQWNGILRDYIRTETALRLTVGNEARAVPVKVIDGMPRPLAEILTDFEGLEWLLLNRPLIEGAANGTRFLERHIPDVMSLLPDGEAFPQPGEVERVAATAERLLILLDKTEALTRIAGCQEDVLGAYFFRIPEIRLYWVPIGIVAAMLAVPVDALTVVVLAHELAHAYSHLGRDIDNEVWNTDRFAGAELSIVEGLAQFYTQTVCSLLVPRFPAAHKAYEALLAKQSGPYKAHRDWVGNEERGGEIVRVTMIECRSRGMQRAEHFLAAINRHREQVKGRKKPGTGSAGPASHAEET